MHRRKSWIAAVAVVALAVAAGSVAAAPAAGAERDRSAPRAWSGLAARIVAVLAAPRDGAPVPRSRDDRRPTRRAAAEAGCMIDPNGCKPKG